MIDLDFLTRHLRPPVGETIFYVAGPAGFVAAVVEALRGAGADPDNIRSEEFAGY